MKCTYPVILSLLGGVELAQAVNVPYNSLLTEGQGFNTFLGKGRKHGAVTITKGTKRSDEAAPPADDDQSLPFTFTPPEADITGVDVVDYFKPPEADEIDTLLAELDEADKEDNKVRRRGIRGRADNPSTSISCPGKLQVDTKLLTSYEKYLKALDISASATISGWGQSASMSGTYLDKSEFSSNSLIYIAKLEVTKQQNVNDKFEFNTAIYKNTNFDADFGDRWIRGFETGGKMIARLVITSKDKASTKEIQAKAEASLKFWGASADISASVKKSMDELSKEASVKVSLFYQGDLGKVQEDKGSPATISENAAQDAFQQVKKWSDTFLQNACSHTYKYQALLDEYNTLGNFPKDQNVIDYGVAEQISYIVLRELAKIAEMKQVLSENPELEQKQKDDVEFAYLDMVTASQNWTKAVAKDPSNARKLAEELLAKFKSDFYVKYQKDLVVGQKNGERCGTQGDKKKCGKGLCCSSIGYCGNTGNHCGWFYSSFCQTNYGNCYEKTSESGAKCGSSNGNKACADGLCCSGLESGTCAKKGGKSNPFGTCPKA